MAIIASVGAIATAITVLAFLRASDGYETVHGFQRGSFWRRARQSLWQGRHRPPAKRLGERVISRYMDL